LRARDRHRHLDPLGTVHDIGRSDRKVAFVLSGGEALAVGEHRHIRGTVAVGRVYGQPRAAALGACGTENDTGAAVPAGRTAAIETEACADAVHPTL